MGYLPHPPDNDPITGSPLTGHEDEPVRVVIEGLLLKRGFTAADIAVEPTRHLHLGDEAVTVKVDLLVSRRGRPALVVRCAPGSLASRIQETIARARLIAEPWAPLAVSTNGVDARLIEVADGRTLAKGLQAIPGPEELDAALADRPPRRPTPAETEKALRVYLAYAAFKCPTDCTF